MTSQPFPNNVLGARSSVAVGYRTTYRGFSPLTRQREPKCKKVINTVNNHANGNNEERQNEGKSQAVAHALHKINENG